jgi:hypothetical protein
MAHYTEINVIVQHKIATLKCKSTSGLNACSRPVAKFKIVHRFIGAAWLSHTPVYACMLIQKLRHILSRLLVVHFDTLVTVKMMSVIQVLSYITYIMINIKMSEIN